MPGDLLTMKARIADELSRPDMLASSSIIADAINTAISVYQQERFRFSDVNPTAPPTFLTVAGRWIYTSVDNANIGSAMGIDYIDADIGTASVIRLRRDQPNNLRLYNLPNQQMMGQPDTFAYEGNELLIAPIPDKAYVITLGLFRMVPAPASDAEANNPWMIDGELLIRSRAKYEIAVHVTRNPKMAQSLSPSAPAENGGMVGESYRAWKRLKGTANRITGTGRIRPMAF